MLIVLAAALIACNDPAVQDGDTLRCAGERVRLFGVDAPEVRRGKAPPQPFSEAARQALIRLTRGRVACRFVNRDRYGRFVGKCWSTQSADINAAVIRSGFATEYRRYSKGLYAKAEGEARLNGRGLWRQGPRP